MDSIKEAAEKVRDEILAAEGKAIAVTLDVTSKEGWNAALQRVIGELGGVEIL